ncbi:MAG: anthranilate phosphoribosyltransferase [Actinomycetota bacterium]|nr:anthranilate phosphoribosyltransferase [Actinomycetota bacterium]
MTAPDVPLALTGQVTWADVLGRLLRLEDLDDATAAAVMTRIMEGEATPAQVAGLLVALRMKGETPAEIAGLVLAMRRYALRVRVEGPVVDTCGTGGDRAGTFNISTLAALVAAGAGARVVKHGNRAASGRCGSADLLEAWGVPIDLAPGGVEACIDSVGIGFCFAPVFHPAMRHAMTARRELGVPTVFNFLGPLTNPAGARHQTIGVNDPAMAPHMAAVLARLGTGHTLVFHGSDGLDELTTTGPSRMWEVRGAEIAERLFDPADHGVARARVEDLRGGDVDDNRRIAEAVLDGTSGPPRDVVLVGAAAALVAGDRVDDFDAGLHAAARSIDSGAAADLLQRWVAVSQSLAGRR